MLGSRPLPPVFGPLFAAFFISLAGFVPASSAIAAGTPKPNEEWVHHVVAPGDTLFGLSRHLLQRPGTWREWARLNRLAEPDRLRPGQTLRIPRHWLRVTELPAQVVSVAGEVYLDQTPIEAGALIRPGQILQTSGTGSAVLLLGEGSLVTLAPATQATLSEHRRFPVRLNPTPASADGGSAEGRFAAAMRLIQGRLELLAAKVIRARPLEVTTPTAVIGVRGTEYRVRHDEAQVTRTEVLTGQVWVDATGLPQSGRGVAAGQGVWLQADRPARIIPLPEAPDLSPLPKRLTAPQLIWNLPGETSPVRLQMATDSDFRRIVRDVQAAPGARLSLAGLADGVWHLRARRIDGESGIEGRDAMHQVLLSTELPPGPIAQAPDRTAKNGFVTLTWADEWPDSAEVRYQVEVSRDEHFNEVLLRSEPLTGRSTPLALPAPGSYWWRVARMPRSATDPSGASAWSAVPFELSAPVGENTGR